MSEQIKEKGNYCAKPKCLSTGYIKAAVSTAEQEIKGDLARKKIEHGFLKPSMGTM